MNASQEFIIKNETHTFHHQNLVLINLDFFHLVDTEKNETHYVSLGLVSRKLSWY